MAGLGDYKKGDKFTLKSGNVTSFKSMGSSPAKQAGRYHNKGLDVSNYGGLLTHGVSFTGGKKGMSTTSSLTPHINVGKSGKSTLGVKFSGKSDKDLIPAPVNPFRPINTQTSLTGKLNLSGKGGRHGLNSGFVGSLSGNVGARDLYNKNAPKRGKLTYGGKLSLGVGTEKKNVKAFGEYGSKYQLSDGGVKVGLSGRYKGIKGSASYNLKTKQPEFKLGFTI